MTQVNRLNGRIVQIERERDELQRLNFKLRDKLLELAKECENCQGAGVVNKLKDPGWPHQGYRQVPCPACADIREVLGQ